MVSLAYLMIFAAFLSLAYESRQGIAEELKLVFKGEPTWKSIAPACVVILLASCWLFVDSFNKEDATESWVTPTKQMSLWLSPKFYFLLGLVAALAGAGLIYISGTNGQKLAADLSFQLSIWAMSVCWIIAIVLAFAHQSGFFEEFNSLKNLFGS